MDLDQSGQSEKKIFTCIGRSLQQNDMIFCKHDSLLPCFFFFQFEKSNFRRNEESYLPVCVGPNVKNCERLEYDHCLVQKTSGTVFSYTSHPVSKIAVIKTLLRPANCIFFLTTLQNKK